ncbi:MAG: hypothetical protein GXO73_08485 [Calditrichaeota bacterium]|nr:hypothetical protein [Calditrichota bacterium]
MLATDLADYLVLKGVPFREAHGIVASMVKEAEKQGIGLGQWSVSEFQRFSDRFGPDVVDYLSVENSLSRRNVYGGTGKASVEQQLKRAREILTAAEEKEAGS